MIIETQKSHNSTKEW